MKKIFKLLIFFLAIYPLTSFGAIDFNSGNFTAENVKFEQKLGAVEEFKPATLINYQTGYRVAVYSKAQADKFFSLGYSLDKNLLGFSVVTNYSTTLSSSITATQTTIPVGTTKDKKGEQLATSTLGMKIYLNIEPGGNKEELVVCTGISGDNWTGCTRGLAFSGTSEAAVSAYQYAHSAGSRVVMSNIHYVYNQFVDKLNPLSESTYTPTTDYNLTTKTWVENRNGYWEGSVANFAALPLTNNADGAARVTLDDSKLYVWDSNTSTWNLAGAGGGAGTVYRTTLLGTESTGDDNKTFTLTSGSFPDKKYLQVYKNGVLQVEGTGNDYVATGYNQAIFEDVVLDDDVITLLVVSVDLYNPAWNSVNGDILPDVDSAYDIGTTSKKFKDLHLSGTSTASAYIGNGNALTDIIDAFGSGADGDVTVSVSTSTARDMYYNNLTINNGVTLNPNGYRIFVRGTLTFVGTGKIARNGNNGANGVESGNTSDMTVYRSAGGAALANGTIYGGLAGGYGGYGGTSGGYGFNSDPGQAGTNMAYSIPAVAGAGGGAGGSGSNSLGNIGGIGGIVNNTETVSAITSRSIILASTNLNAENGAGFFDSITLYGSNSTSTLSSNAGSGGGGGGGQSGAFSQAQGGCGGGGGGNGGVIYISAHSIVTVNGNTFVQAKGGNGGNGGNGGSVSNYYAGGGGGGAGGQGGFIILVYRNLSGTGVIDVAGGTKGTGGLKGGGSATNGTDGTNGNTGKYLKIKLTK